MPITTHWEPEGFVFKSSGIVTAEEIFESGDDFLKVPDGISPKYQLVDCLEVEKFELDEVDVVNISADDLSASRKYPNIKVAMIAQKGHVTEKFVNYLKVSWAINTSWEIRIFNSLESARDWLSHFAEMPEPNETSPEDTSKKKEIRRNK